MRILIVYPKTYVYGGAEVLVTRLCNYLTSKGIKHSLLSTTILPQIQKEIQGTNVIIAQNKISNIIGEIIALQRGVHKYINDFDIINVHNFPAELSVFPHHKPTVWMCNEPEVFLYRHNKDVPFKSKLFFTLLSSFEKYVVKNYITKIVVADAFNAERFKRIYGIIPYVINYGIDYDFFSQGDAKETKEKMGLANKFVLLHVGMLTPFKNQIASLKTIKKLKRIIPNVILIFAGAGKKRYKLELEKYIMKNGLEDIVVFTGHIDRRKVRDYYYACDILLHPIKSQGGWLAPFEALCAAKLIIVSPEMTASDIIMREKIGIVTDHFVEAITKIYKDPSEYQTLATRGREWVRENLSWNKYCEKMLEIFHHVADDSL